MTLTAATADIWVAPTEGVDDGVLDESVLDDTERDRAGRFARRVARARTRYVAAHVALRHILASYTGHHPGDLRFARAPCPGCGAPHGRPVLAGPPSAPHFSLSHSGELAVVGVAAHPVGVDVELFPDDATVAAVADRLHPAERAEIGSAAPDERRRAFARIWCRKEAYLKAVGIGVVADLTADYVGSGRSPDRPAGVTLADLPVAGGAAGAVAVLAPGYHTRVFRFAFPGFAALRRETAKPAINRM